jgi:hypothetical protein
MATIDDAILEIARGTGTPEEKVKIIRELTRAAPTDRWTLRYVIWGLIAVVVLTIVAVIIPLFHGAKELATLPQGIVALASTSLGALAAYLVPPSTHSTPATIPPPSTETTSLGSPPGPFAPNGH